jgi:hypothetical protein
MDRWLRFAPRRPYRWSVLLLVGIAGVIACRLIVPLRGGQFGPDESQLMLLASRVLHGDAFPLLGLQGTHGMPYGPYPTYFHYSALYGLTGFDFRWAFCLFGLLLILSGLAVAESVAAEGCRVWTFIFAVTSPPGHLVVVRPLGQYPAHSHLGPRALPGLPSDRPQLGA